MTPQERKQKMMEALADAQAKVGTAQNTPTLGGVAKAGASGVRTGGEGLVGLPGDAPGMAGGAVSFGARKLDELLTSIGLGDRIAADTPGILAENITEGGKAIMDPRAKIALLARWLGFSDDEGPLPMILPTSKQVGAGTDAAVNALPSSISEPIQDITRHVPQNAIEELAATGGVMATGAAFPGSTLARFARVAGPTGAVEGAGQATRQAVEKFDLDPEWENVARIVAGLVSGGVGAKGAGDFTTRRALTRINTKPEAVERAKVILRDSGMDEAAIEAEMQRLGVGTTPADVNTNMLQETQRLQAAGGAAKGVIDPMIKARELERNNRLVSDSEAAVGTRLQPSDIEKGLLKRKQAIGQQYPAVKSNQSRPSALQSIADELDAELATARGGMRSKLQKVRDMLDIPGAKGNLDPSSEGVHAMRVELDNMIKKAAPGSPLYARLNEYRKKIDAELKDIAPGIKSLDEQYSQVKKEEGAFEQGQAIYENPKGAPTEVEFEQTYNAMSPGEKARVAEGLNVATFRELGIKGNDLVELERMIRGEGKWNYEKVKTVIGEEKTRALMTAIEREKVWKNTHQKVIEGSKTAATLPGGESGPGLVKTAVKAIPEMAGALAVDPSFNMSAGIGLSRLRQYASDLRKKGGGGAADADLARLLTSTDPAQLRQAIEIINRRGLVLPEAVLGALQARKREIGADQ